MGRRDRLGSWLTAAAGRPLAAALVALPASAPSLAADDPRPRHLIYLHGRIVQEQQDSRPHHPRFGYYELERILDTFQRRGFVVRAPRRGVVQFSGS